MNNKIIDTGLIYRNPRPHVISRHAYFPWVVFMDNGELLCSIVTGEAFESVDLDTFLVRSKDMGESWSQPMALLEKDEISLYSRIARISTLSNGEVVAILVKSHREDHPDEGLANPENLGFVPTEEFLVRSYDYGQTWDKPEKIDPPLIGPSFEACSPIVVLKDGRWLWPTSTWRGWDGYCPNGMKMVAWISYDKGKTWPEYMNVMDDSQKGIIYWESKIIELSQGSLLAVSWAYDEKAGRDLPNHFSISEDSGKAWSKPTSTGLLGQTMAISELPDGRILVVYRRMDKPGLWATLVRIKDENWVNESQFPLWGVQENSLTDKSANMVHDFNNLKFGAPCITILPDQSAYIAFWCYENYVSNIRWLKINM